VTKTEILKAVDQCLDVTDQQLEVYLRLRDLYSRLAAEIQAEEDERKSISPIGGAA